MIENVTMMAPGLRSPTFDGSLWGPRVCRCNGHVDPHEHTRMHPYGRSIFDDDESPLRPPQNPYVGIRRNSDPEDNPWPSLFALLALFALVFAAGCAAFGWPLP